MSQHQMRRPGPNTKTCHALTHRVDQGRMIRETEVIIAAERGVIASINGDMRGLRRVEHSAQTPQTERFQFSQLISQAGVWHSNPMRYSQVPALNSIGVIPSRANKA